MRIVIKNSIAIAAAVIATGCSTVTDSSIAKKAGLFPDRENQYLESHSLPPLKTPAGVPAIPNDPYFAIPDSSASQLKPVSLLPPGSLAAKEKK